MEDLPLPSIFEQARKIHTAATESASDQVSLSYEFFQWFLVFSGFNFLFSFEKFRML